VVLEGLHINELKEKLPALLKEGYENLKEATFILRENVLEIKFDAASLHKYHQEIMKLTCTLYNELTPISVPRTKQVANKLYQDALQKLRTRRNHRAIQNTKDKTE